MAARPGGVRAETGGPCTARALLLQVPWSLASPWQFGHWLRPRFWAWQRISQAGPLRLAWFPRNRSGRKRRSISRGPQPPLPHRRSISAGRRHLQARPEPRYRRTRKRESASNRRHQRRRGPHQFPTSNLPSRPQPQLQQTQRRRRRRSPRLARMRPVRPSLEPSRRRRPRPGRSIQR